MIVGLENLNTIAWSLALWIESNISYGGLILAEYYCFTPVQLEAGAYQVGVEQNYNNASEPQ